MGLEWAIPRTMDELARAAGRSRQRRVFPGLAMRPDIDTFAAFFRAFGGEWLDSGEPLRSSTKRACVQSVSCKNWSPTARPTPSTGGWTEEFNKGNMAMFIHSNSTIPWVPARRLVFLGATARSAGDVAAATVAGRILPSLPTQPPRSDSAPGSLSSGSSLPEVNARFSVGTGYLPVRRSALELPIMREYIAGAPGTVRVGSRKPRPARLRSGPAGLERHAWLRLGGHEERVLLTDADPQASLLNRRASHARPSSTACSTLERDSTGCKNACVVVTQDPPLAGPARCFEGYLYVLPAFLILGLFHLWPSIYTFFLHLHNWNFIRRNPTLIGLTNYERLWANKYFWLALKNTAVYTRGGAAEHRQWIVWHSY